MIPTQNQFDNAQHKPMCESAFYVLHHHYFGQIYISLSTVYKL